MENQYTYTICNKTHLQSILNLQEVAFAHLTDSTLLRRNSSEMFHNCLQPPHTTLGAFLNEQLIAIAILYNPIAHPEEALSPYLQSINPHKLIAANYKLCIVHPDHRGFHLQQTLGIKLEKYALQQGINLLCSTASPNNHPSIHNLLAIDYQFDSHLVKYGFDRNLYYKFLQ